MPPTTGGAETRGRGGARAGRGGRDGSRGGGRGGSKKMVINGEEMTWDYDEDFEVDNKPVTLFPDISIPTMPPPTPLERAGVASWLKFRRHVHESPLYTVMGENVRVGKPNSSAHRKGAVVNPFEDMPTYTQKYRQQAKTLPRFEKGSYVLKLFPPELWDVVDPSRRPSKAMKINAPARPKSAAEKPRVVGGDEEDIDDDEGNADEDENADEEDPDENYEEGDSDMGGDYNAEQYFDGGDEDLGEEGGGTGGDEGGGEEYD